MSSMMCGMLLGAGVVSTKTYVDDVFSTYLYKGNNSTNTLNTGLDMSGEGGLVWLKARSSARQHILFDTARGANKKIASNDSAAEYDGTGVYNQTFTSTGFTVNNTLTDVNDTNVTYSSWNFRKAPGFFDVVTYTGNDGASRAISHSLGSVPGMIMIKRLDASTDWVVYHRNLNNSVDPHTYILELNKTTAESNLDNCFTAAPTSSTFTVGDNSDVNQNSNTYVAYVFAGGESTAATAKSFSFAADVCLTDSSSNYTLGTSDFTLEYWYKADQNPSSGNYSYIVDYNDDDWATRVKPDGTHQYMVGDTARITSTTPLGEGQWHHIAIVRSSGTSRMYINGVQEGGTYSDSTNYSFTQFYMGRRYNGTNQLYGKVSNLRLVVGTAVYTSSFRPPTEPLTNITNTKLLGLNSSSLGATVGTIQGTGNTDLNPTASTDSPFDDPAGFKFGDAGDQNVIKTGSFVGAGSSAVDVNIGFEPSWVMIKNASAAENWFMFDNMRGVTTGGNDNRLQADETGSEFTTFDYLEFNSTGFKVNANATAGVNGDGNTMTFLAIRRPDGYVGKPPELGTGVFAMATGTSSADPQFVSGFTTDFMLRRAYASSTDWVAGSRLIGTKYLITNSTATESTTSGSVWDYMNGMGDWSQDTTSQLGWNWKRHAGFDVVAYTGLGGTIASYAHNLNKIPEMMWVKRRDSTNPWSVYHKGLNGGSSPEGYGVQLNTNAVEASSTTRWASTAPTSTHFFAGGNTGTNNTDSTYIAMLFASIDGISKCGQYTPASGSTSTTVTCGFSPRLVIVKCVDAAGSWHVGDTLRGISSSGNDPVLMLNENWEQDAYGARDWLEVSSTGFTVKSVSGGTPDANRNGDQYIYYAHA